MVERELRRLSLDEFVALNDEIAALARAGVPMDKGLRALANDLPGRLGEIADSIGARLEGGEALAEALDRVGEIPSAYRAVLTAGLRTGRLAAAVEGIATAARRARDVRRGTIVGLLYPLILFAVFSMVLSFTTRATFPVVIRMFDDFGLQRPYWFELGRRLANGVTPLLPAIWSVIAVAAVGWWARTRRLSSLHTGGASWLPATTRLIREGRLAVFAELLALLIEHRVPLEEAVPLAADSTGDEKLRAAGREFSRRHRSGGGMTTLPTGIPPVLGWLLVSSGDSPRLIRCLRGAAAGHRERAARLGNALGTLLPIVLAAGLGGLVTLASVLLVMWPFYHLIHHLG